MAVFVAPMVRFLAKIIHFTSLKCVKALAFRNVKTSANDVIARGQGMGQNGVCLFFMSHLVQ